MVHLVEEAREVQIHDPSLPLHLVVSRCEHRLVSTASWPKPVAVPREARFKQRGQHLKRRLLDEPVQYRRNGGFILPLSQQD